MATLSSVFIDLACNESQTYASQLVKLKREANDSENNCMVFTYKTRMPSIEAITDLMIQYPSGMQNYIDTITIWEVSNETTKMLVSEVTGQYMLEYNHNAGIENVDRMASLKFMCPVPCVDENTRFLLQIKSGTIGDCNQDDYTVHAMYTIARRGTPPFPYTRLTISS